MLSLTLNDCFSHTATKHSVSCALYLHIALVQLHRCTGFCAESFVRVPALLLGPYTRHTKQRLLDWTNGLPRLPAYFLEIEVGFLLRKWILLPKTSRQMRKLIILTTGIVVCKFYLNFFFAD